MRLHKNFWYWWSIYIPVNSDTFEGCTYETCGYGSINLRGPLGIGYSCHQYDGMPQHSFSIAWFRISWGGVVNVFDEVN